MTIATLIWGLLFSSIGIGYFIYGRKQARPVIKYSGLALMVYPYFVPNTLLVIVIGAVCMALPLILEI